MKKTLRSDNSARRRHLFEQLERRDLLAAQPFGTNPLQPLDVTRDGKVSALDALRVINAVAKSENIGVAEPSENIGDFVDVTGDGQGTALDALRIINILATELPIIAATLPNDSAPASRPELEFDLLTNQYAIDLSISVAELGDHAVELQVGETNPFVDITSQFTDGSASLTAEEIDAAYGQQLPDGDHPIAVRIADGNAISFVLTVDTLAPAPQPAAGGVVRVATEQLDLSFGEPIVSPVDLDAFTLRQIQGPTIEPLSIDPISDFVQLVLPERLTDAQFELTYAGSVEDLAGNVASPATGTFTVADPAGIESISPANGERQVNVTRETVITFDEPVDPATVTEETIEVWAGGQVVPGTIRVNRTGRTATFFYDAPLPASTAVTVTIDGDAIRGVDGFPLDANGDNLPGGISNDTFRTLPLTLIPGTEIFGYVKDSQTQLPLEGVVISLEAYPEIYATSNSDGYFELGTADSNNDGTSDGLPAPDFFVFIDGSTATAADGSAYAYLGKPFHSVPGQRTQLEMAGNPFDIFLPPIPNDAKTPIVAGEETAVTFGSDSLEDLAAMMPTVAPELWQQMQVSIAADSAMNEAGEMATEAFVVPVEPAFLPAPLPANLNPQLVVSIQAPGTTNFDVPAAVTFPNMDGLLPGEQMLLYSFNHDAGRFEINGTATVNEDGLGVSSDPGVGVAAPGWHFVQPGTSANGPRPPIPSPKPDLPGPTDPPEDPPCLTRREIVDTVLDVGAQALTCVVEIADVRKGIKRAFSAAKLIRGAVSDVTSLLKSIDDEDRAAITRDVLRLLNRKSDILDIVDAIKDESPVNKALEMSKCIEGFLGVAENVCGRLQDKGDDCYSPWARVTCTGISLARTQLRKVNRLVEKADKGIERLTAELLCSKIDEAAALAGIVAGGNGNEDAEGESVIDFAALRRTALELNSELDIQEENVEPVEEFGEVFEEGMLLFEDSNEAAALWHYEWLGSPANAYWSIEAGDFVQRGRTDGDGTLSVSLPANTTYTITIYDHESKRLGQMVCETGPSGTRYNIKPLRFTAVIDLPDTDLDGLADKVEKVLGTLVDEEDTDGDGLSDGFELDNGLDPIGGAFLPTGIIASISLSGPAVEVEVEGSTDGDRLQTAYVATGNYGLAIVDTSQFDNPILLGEIDLAGNANDVAVDSRVEIAAVASQGGGLHFVDVSDPQLPAVLTTVEGSFQQVEVLNGVAYAAARDALVSIDLFSGEELGRVSLAGGVIDDMAIADGFIYTIQRPGVSPHTVHKVLANSNLDAPMASLSLTDFPTFGRMHIAAGDGLIYVGSPDESFSFQVPGVEVIRDDGDELTLIGPPSAITAFEVSPNGSGLVLFGGANTRGPRSADFGILDLSDPTDTDNFITSFATPGSVNSIAIGSGIAFVADMTGGLQVINYLPFDANGQAPSVSFVTAAIDRDPNAAGVQVEEGTTVALDLSLEDDVQVRNVELIVNGETVRNDVSFPFDFAAVVPNLDGGTDIMTIQVRATDTGGNSTLSQSVDLQIIPDITPPTITRLTPEEIALVGTRLVSVTLSEPVDTESVSLSSIQVVDRTDGDSLIAPSSLAFQNNDRTALFRFAEPFPEGEYRLTLLQSDFRDRGGNPLGDDPLVRDFELVEATAVWANPAGGFWDDPANWEDSRLPSPDDGVLIPPLNAGAEVVIRRDTEVQLITVGGDLRLQSGNLSSNQIRLRGGTFHLESGDLSNSLVVDQTTGGTAEAPVRLRSTDLSGVTFNTDVSISPPTATYGRVDVDGGLTLNGTLTIAAAPDGWDAGLVFHGTQTFDGTGSVVFSADNGATQPRHNFIELRNTDSSLDEVLTIGDSLSFSGLGSIRGSFNDFIQFAGSITGTEGSDLQISGLTGSIRLDDPFASITVNGLLKDLTVNGTSSTVLNLADNTTLDNVILNTDAIISPPSRTYGGVDVLSGLTLNGTLTIAATSGGWSAGLSFYGTQTFDGTGSVIFSADNGADTPQDNAIEFRNSDSSVDEVLTIGPDISIGGYGTVGSNNPTRDTIAGEITFDDPSSETLILDGLSGAVIDSTEGTRVNLRLASLDNMTLNTDAIISPPANTYGRVDVTGGLTLNGTLTIAATSGGYDAGLQFQGAQMFDGTGSVVFSGDNGAELPRFNFIELRNTDSLLDEVLTIGESLSFSGLGSIRSNFNDSIQFAGSITGTEGSDLQISDLTGEVLLDDPFASVTINGSLRDLTVDGTAGTVLNVATNSTLENVTLNTDAIISPPANTYGHVDVLGGLTLNGTLTIAATSGGWDAGLFFEGTQTFDGNGSVVFSAANGADNPQDNFIQLRNTDSRFDEVLTIGPGISIGGYGTVGSNNPTSDTITGTVTIDDPFSETLILDGLKDAVVKGTEGTIVNLRLGSLNNLTLNTDAIIAPPSSTYGRVDVVGGLTLNGTLTIAATSGGWTSGLYFDGTQTFDGTGSVVFSRDNGAEKPEHNFIELRNTDSEVDELLTIGESLSFSGFGSIRSNNDNDLIELAGTIVGTEDGDLRIRNLTGELFLDDPFTGITVNGLLSNLIVNGTASTVFKLDNFSTLDNVTLNTDAIISQPPNTYGRVEVVGGLTLNSTLTIAATSGGWTAGLYFDGTQTLDGTGSVVFTAVNGASLPEHNFIELRNTDSNVDEVLTIGTELTIGGFGTVTSNNPTTDSVVMGASINQLAGDELVLGAGVLATGRSLVVQITGLAASDYGRVTGQGALELPDTLTVQRPTGFSPNVGDEFSIIDLGELTGTIGSIEGDEFGDIRLVPQISDGLLKLLAEDR